MPRGIPNQAKNNPVFTGPVETKAEHYAVPQRDPIDVDRVLADGAEPIAIVQKLPSEDYMEALKFAEDPLVVILNPSPDPKAARFVYCAVQGKGAEVWDERTKKWLEFKYLPVGRVLTIKRKYLEVLARSRTDTFNTREVTPTPLANQDGYTLDASTVMAASFNVRHDPAGAKGQEWYSRVMSEF